MREIVRFVFWTVMLVMAFGIYYMVGGILTAYFERI